MKEPTLDNFGRDATAITAFNSRLWSWKRSL